MILPKGKTRMSTSSGRAVGLARQSGLVHDRTQGVMSLGSDDERTEGLFLKKPNRRRPSGVESDPLGVAVMHSERSALLSIWALVGSS